MKEPVTTDPKGEVRQMSNNTSALVRQKTSMEMASYITGFVDGEGSFLVSFSRRPALVTGIEVRPSFSVSQHERSREVLLKVQKHFGCGTIRYDGHDQTYKYEVRSLKDLLEHVIPHFETYPLQTAKALDFDRFVYICSLMRTGGHRSRNGLEEILHIAYAMNHYGARRYQLSDLLQIVDKMKV